MRRKLQTLLFALVAMMMPIGAWAQLQKILELPSGSGVTTLCLPYDVELDAYTKAYVVTDVIINEDGSVQLVEEELPDGKIPASTAVIIRNEKQATETNLDVITGLEPFITEEANLLKGTLVPISLDLSRESDYFALHWDITKDYLGINDWQAPVRADGMTTYTLAANKAYLDLSGKLEPSKIAELKTLPHLQHTHGGCEICGQVTGIEAAWGATADDLTEGTLENAIFNAGVDSNIGYIKLLADVESTGVIVDGGTFTLDLNGHTISSESHTLQILNESTVTIEDNSSEKSGKVISSGDGYVAVFVDGGASVTINSGTYESTLYALNVEGDNSSITINGGSYESFSKPVVIGEGCSATITGGTFTSTSSYAITNHGTLDIAGGTFISEVIYTLDTNGTLIIKGGAFSAGENYAVLEYSGGTLNLSEYEQDITTISLKNTSGNDIVPGEETILLPEGYCFYKGEENVTELVYGESYTIGEAPTIEDAEAVWYESEEAEAPLGFGSLSDAFAAAAEENSTVGYIQLQVDVENGVIINSGTFTLDLNGHTIGVYGLQIQGADTHVTLKGETEGSVVFANNGSSPAVNVIYGASVTIESGTYTNDYNIAVNNNTDCSVTIIDGVFESTLTPAIENKGDLVIKGGTFTTSDDLSTISYSKGSINLSEYENITDISIGSWIYPSLIPSAETILLPEGYCFFDSEGIPVTVLEGGGTYYIADEPAQYAITFEANGGEGEMEDVIVYEGDYTLPECAFNAPEGMMFGGWQVGDDEENLYQPGEEITVTADTEIKAVFVPQIVINMYDSYGDGWNGASITVKKDGEELDETVTIEDGTEATVTLVYDQDSRYTFYWNMGSNDVECEFEIIVNGESVYIGLGSDFSDDFEFFFALGNPFVVSFNANDGSGSMDDIETYESVTLPECTFNAPEGMMFKAWQIGEDEYQPGEVVIIEDNTTITAVWTAYVPQIIIKMHDSCEDGWHGDAIVVKKNGEEIGIATIIEEDAADGIVRYDYDNTAEYTFYWSCNHEQELEENPYYCCYPEECYFEIFIDDEEVFAADNDKCDAFEDGELIHTIEGEAQVVESLTIVDGEHESFYVEKNHENVDITYTRTLPNLMWNALYVPFEIPVSELLDNYDVAYFNNMHAYDRDVNGAIDEMEMEVIFIKEGTLHANHPYFIRAKSEAAKELTLELSDATLYSTAEEHRTSITTSSAYMEFTLTGVYEQKTGEDGVYAINTEGAWSPIAEGAKLNPFRLFLQMTTRSGSPVKVDASAAKAFRIRAVGDDTTGIENSEFRIQKSEMIYDLMGRRVLEPQKGGIYIVNGKKVVW